MCSAGYHEKMIGRTYFGGDQVTQLNLVLYNTIKWPYQPKHSPSLCRNGPHFLTSNDYCRSRIRFFGHQSSEGKLISKIR